jgi:hypothetical protein
MFSVWNDAHFLRGFASCRSSKYKRGEETVAWMTMHYKVLSKAVLKQIVKF